MVLNRRKNIGDQIDGIGDIYTGACVSVSTDVLTGVADAVAVRVLLTRVGYIWTVVGTICYTVAIRVTFTDTQLRHKRIMGTLIRLIRILDREVGGHRVARHIGIAAVIDRDAVPNILPVPPRYVL